MGSEANWQDAHEAISNNAQFLATELYHMQQRLKGAGYQTNDQTRIAELETELRQCHEYMRLKDQAKIKVEMQRDTYKRQLSWAELRADAVKELKAQNAEQATAFKIAKAENKLLSARLSAAEKQVVALQDVLALGRKGLESEWKDW